MVIFAAAKSGSPGNIIYMPGLSSIYIVSTGFKNND